jgi:hypothetical protein
VAEVVPAKEPHRGPSVTSTCIRGPDGQDNWIAIECKSAQLACVAEAGRVCPNGYDVADQLGHEGQESSGYAQANAAAASPSRARVRRTQESYLSGVTESRMRQPSGRRRAPAWTPTSSHRRVEA